MWELFQMIPRKYEAALHLFILFFDASKGLILMITFLYVSLNNDYYHFILFEKKYN